MSLCEATSYFLYQATQVSVFPKVYSTLHCTRLLIIISTCAICTYHCVTHWYSCMSYMYMYIIQTPRVPLFILYASSCTCTCTSYLHNIMYRCTSPHLHVHCTCTWYIYIHVFMYMIVLPCNVLRTRLHLLLLH